MKYTNKLKMAMIATNINQVKLAELTKQSQENLSQKMAKNNFKMQEFEKLITAIEKDRQAILLVGKADYEEELAISSLEEKGITVCDLAERKENLIYITDAENGKISYRGEVLTLFDTINLNIKDSEICIEAYGNNISIFRWFTCY